MKKIIITVLLIASLTVVWGASATSSGTETAAELDGVIISAPALIDGTAVWLPFRAVCEELGYTVNWKNAGGVITVYAVRDGDSVTIDATHQSVTHNGHLFDASVLSGGGVRILSGRTYLTSGLFSSIFPISSAYDSAAGRLTLSRRFDNDMVIDTETVASQQVFLNSMVQYPQLKGLTGEDAQAAINDILARQAQAALDRGSKNADDMAQAIRDGFTGAVGRCETYFDYTVTYNQNGLFSVVLSEYQYAGGAHGSTVQTAYTFDLSTGRALRLGDLLKADSGYTDFINGAVRKEIDSRVAADILSEFHFSPFEDIGDAPEFYLSSAGIVIYFQEYAYFPYTAGIQEFVIGYHELSPMMKDTCRFLADAPVMLKPEVKNTLPVGVIGRVKLDGNPTTGYDWYFTVSDESMLTLVSDGYTSTHPGADGAGGTYVWNFKGLKPGEAKITFKYYRAWEGEDSAEKTAVYRVTVA